MYAVECARNMPIDQRIDEHPIYTCLNLYLSIHVLICICLVSWISLKILVESRLAMQICYIMLLDRFLTLISSWMWLWLSDLTCTHNW